MRWFKRINLRHVNWLLIALIIIIDGYIAVSPLLPQFDLWKRKHRSAAVSGLPYHTKLDKNSGANNIRTAVPKDNRLVIPKLALNEHIYLGTSAYLVNLGVWDKANTSTPPKGGNTVMIAHRFTYHGPAIFYSLGSLAAGDHIVVYWQSKEFDYTVLNTKTVDATDLAVENPSKKSILTLYTCTPLWTAEPKYRIVVTALLDS